MKRNIGIVLVTAIVGGLVGAAIGIALGDRGSQPRAAAARPRVAASPAATATAEGRADPTPEEIYRRDAPGVVVITDTQTQVIPPTFFTPEQKQQVGALGSGFVIDRKGDVVTNDHVVQGSTGIRVGFDGGATYAAKLVGADPSTDVAVVRVQAPTSVLHPLAFERSGLFPGDPVYAIGNPFGLDRTMTAGIVSAVGRDIDAPNGLAIPNAIQTDAPINHGNSGGPLLDRAGRVVGVNAQIEGGTVDANVGVGFAIPTATARSVAAQLIATGRARHAWLGVRVATIDPADTKLLRGLPSHGVAITRVVKDGPAAVAGLRGATRTVTVNGAAVPLGGDSITGVDGNPIFTAPQLADAIAVRKPGERVRLQVSRNGDTRTVTVELGDVPGAGGGVP